MRHTGRDGFERLGLNVRLFEHHAGHFELALANHNESPHSALLIEQEVERQSSPVLRAIWRSRPSPSPSPMPIGPHAGRGDSPGA